jgi:hypothetical protein
LFFVSVLAGAPASAQNDQVRQGPRPPWVSESELLPVPQDAGGLVFVRRQDFVVHLDDQGQSQYLGYRTRILHANALQLGNVSIAWNPAAGAPTVHVIRVYRDGETIDVLKKASFEILRREDQLEAARLDGSLTAILRIPDLRVGDELEVGLTLPNSDPTLRNNVAGILTLAPQPAPGRYRLRLSWAKSRKPSIKMTPDMQAARAESAQAIDFRFDNPPAVILAKDAPPRHLWKRIVEFSNFPDWSAVSRQFAPLYVKAAKLSEGSAVKREASRIAAARSNPFDRASAALKLVQQDVRYIYVGLDGGNLTPSTAEETWQRRYGDCKGKTALLLALLAELKIEAEPVLVNSAGLDDGLDERLPNPGMFDHVIVRARIGDAVYWLDGTLPPVAGPAAAPVFPFRWVLPLRVQGGSIERLEWQAPTAPDEVSTFEIDARAGFDKPARITSTTIIRGLKGLQQQAQLSAVAPDQLLNSFRQEAVGDTWQVIDDVKWHYDEKAAASILTITGTGIVAWTDEDGEKSLALAGGGFNPPERRVRGAGQDQNLPFYAKPEFTCHVTTVRLPGSTQPYQWSSQSAFDTRIFGRNYYRAFELRDGAIRMVRGSRVEHPEIDAATAQRDNGRIAAFDNSMGWITYDPASKKQQVGDGKRVPATYEIDWSAKNVPCGSPPAK